VSALSVSVKPGTSSRLALDSRRSTFRAVFEDDGETGYLYACDRAREDNTILDAVQVYAVQAMPKTSVQLRMRWSADGMKAGLWLGDQLSAVIDFEARRAYSPANFPLDAGAPDWGAREPWRDSLIELFS
jgi:hypothetical protein